MAKIGKVEIEESSVERLGFHPANDSSRPVHIEIRRHFMWLDSWIQQNVPAGREQACARTALQESAMWCNAATAINLAPVVVEEGTFDSE